MVRRFAVLFLILLSGVAAAQNPITPPGMFLADPSARQWRDGRMYVYGSRDESTKYFCSHSYDILSSSDLVNWTVHRETFASRGDNDQVPYSDAVLYAPDCVEREGRYFLYYCQPNKGLDEGVATAETPEGPFTGGVPLSGISGIDPAVFLDDDGTAYYLWGQFSLSMAILNPDMRSIDPSSIRDSVLTEARHFFHEGVQMFKRDGIYYLVYTDISRRGMATSIGYATSNAPSGPFSYRGVIIDNFGCDPQVWNNHGSVARFHDEWYVFYHRSTHGSYSMRTPCVEPIRFLPDGGIPEVEMTSQGAGPPLDPFQWTGAARACYLTGNVRIASDSSGRDMLKQVRHRNTAAFKYFRFSRALKAVTIQAVPFAGGKIHVYAGNLSRTRLAIIDIPSGDGGNIREFSAPIDAPISGVLPVYFRFVGIADDKDVCAIRSFRFE